MPKDKLELPDIKSMFAAASKAIAAREKELCAIDGVCGDGDHGTAIKGAMCAANVSAESAQSIKDAFMSAGMAAMSDSNGSTSTLFGSLFMGISDGVPEGASDLDSNRLYTAFSAGLAAVRENTEADVGDKTLMDALVPAVKAMKSCKSAAESLAKAAEAANIGARNTVELQARFGRARNLGERSKGVPDAGAMSVATIFSAFAGVVS